ncbi:MAG: nitronate monooxygenase [Methylobacterium sp.]|nr:nitronate monooxygenase [Methylobacterium sp.]MCA3602265.1 nitronate monooxygenase [Methylobacterium sp.]MCA3615042.1 nitronate monooxygenase [Methylobacterium sp.]MCA3640966.1 nitronate monooxygenase [Methylobacterium sp.]MCA4908922.1 nitronate monooxygenase [Methylobacterium sp.]
MLFQALAMPIIQAPMLGAGAEALTLAVSRAGGMGSLAAAALGPAALTAAVARLRTETDKSFAINLFILPPTQADLAEVRDAMARLAPWRERYGLPAQNIPNQWAEPFEPQFAALVEAAPPAASFTFGILTRDQVSALKSRGTFVVGTATTVAEAKAWEAVGADAVCAQGFEAGGHRGTFLKDVGESQIGMLALLSTIREAIGLPVIAAGGISDGKAIAAVLAMGAAAVQIGTAYLLSEEAATSAPWRRAIAEVADDATHLTRVFSGRYARGIENDFMREMQVFSDEIPAYPIQNALTQELRAAAARAGDAQLLSLWAGQSVKLARPGAAAEITRQLWSEAQAALRETARRYAGEGSA